MTAAWQCPPGWAERYLDLVATMGVVNARRKVGALTNERARLADEAMADRARRLLTELKAIARASESCPTDKAIAKLLGLAEHQYRPAFGALVQSRAITVESRSAMCRRIGVDGHWTDWTAPPSASPASGAAPSPAARTAMQVAEMRLLRHPRWFTDAPQFANEDRGKPVMLRRPPGLARAGVSSMAECAG